MKASATLLVLLAHAILGAAAAAQSPVFSGLAPRGGQRGTEVLVNVTGSRLGGMQEPFLFGEGIEVVSVEQKGEGGAALLLWISEDCPLGDHGIRLRTDRGVTEMRLFSIGTMPEIAERTPNDVLEQAQEIPLETTVNGVLGAEDADWFAVDVPAATPVHVEVLCNRLGIDFDPRLAVYDTHGHEVQVNDDTPFGRLDPVLTLRSDEAARFYLQLTNGSPDNNRSGDFRLHVGRFPRPIATHPCGGRPGEVLDLTYLGDGEPWTERVRLPRDATSAIHAHFPRNRYGTAPTPVFLVVRDLPTVVESQAVPEKERGETIAFETPAALHGVLAEPGEIDRYRFAAKKGQQLEIRALARQLRSSIDAVIDVRQLAGKYRVANDDAGTYQVDSRVGFRAPADGDYEIAVHDRLRRGGSTFAYRVEAAPAEKRATTKISFAGRLDAEHLSVPAGGRMMTVLAVDGGPRGSTPTLTDLPPGVSAQAGSVIPGTGLVPVVLEAVAGAELAGRLASVGLQLPGQNSLVPAPFEHFCALVRVRNNDVYDGRVMRALPVAVTAAAPYSVEVVSPRVPIIQGSPLSLLVRVERTADFKGAVRVKLPWVPPGISASEATIAADKTEGQISLSARDNAAAGSYKTAIYGYPTIGGGLLRTSSSLFELAVATPSMTAVLGKARTEQGIATDLTATLARKKEFTGEAEAKLLNLPRGVTAPVQKVGPDTTKLSFSLTIAANAQTGRHRGTVLRLLVPSGAGPLVHYFRGGELRIDAPITSPTAAKN